MHNEKFLRIKLGNNRTTEAFNTTKGLTQGVVGRTRKCNIMKLKVDNDILYRLYFPDDQVVIVADKEDLNWN